MSAASKKVKAALILRELTEGKLAKRLGVTQGTISHTILGRRRGKQLRKRLAKILNIPMEAWDEMDRELKAQKEASAV